jgi:hypothetical protein
MLLGCKTKICVAKNCLQDGPILVLQFQWPLLFNVDVWLSLKSERKVMSLRVSCEHHIPYVSANSISELFHYSWQKRSIKSVGVGLQYAAGPDWSIHLLEKKIFYLSYWAATC